MRKTIFILCTAALIACAVVCFVKLWVGLLMIIIALLAVFALFLFLLCNKLIKNTNWWNNQFIGTRQFVTNVGYRDNIIRNYDIVNLGSNPARFAFFYEGVKGQSWATGSQGQDMDFEILKYYHSYLREGGTVLIPIMPFTAISPYLKGRPDYWGVQYYSKFAKILDSSQIAKMPCANDVYKYLDYPLLYNKYALLKLINDSEADKRYEMADQQMTTMELQQDASKWIKMWLQEFQIGKLTDVLSERWQSFYNEAIEINKSIVEFCIERSLKPVFICVPMTKVLSDKFPESFKKYMVDDFINKINIHHVPFLDYTTDARFQDENLYIDSFFLNLRGRKLFTNQVLKDLNLVQ